MRGRMGGAVSLASQACARRKFRGMHAQHEEKERNELGWGGARASVQASYTARSRICIHEDYRTPDWFCGAVSTCGTHLGS